MSFLLFLSQKGLFREEDIPNIVAQAEKTEGGIDALLVKGGMRSDQVLLMKSEYYRLPARLLEGFKISPDTLKLIPEDSAKHYKIAPIGVFENVLEVGIVDPDVLQARDAVQFIASKVGMPYRLFIITEIDFADILTQYKNLTGEVTKALSELDEEPKNNILTTEEVEQTSSTSGKGKMSQIGEETNIVEDAPVTKIVAVILKHAVEGGASDVHIEHMGDKIRVRFRVDGVMYTSIILPANIHSAVVARIKILSSMKLDEKRKPQDGRFSVRMEDGTKVDFRVSTFPAYSGEKVVMRILDSSRGIRKLDQMGFNPDQIKMLQDAINTPYGLILITGPTGSGKSTTLYAMLNELDREKKNIISLEDPVEFNIAGINQSQVRPEIGYTFASGLRSILRQDPDIIMVGEIRDKETAQLAVQAALTGHLVFSTLHTNTASGVIPRLLDMEVDPYLIAPTLILAMGQRLLRTMCPDAKKAMPTSESQRMMLERQFSDLPESVRKSIVIPDELYEAVPSPTCPTGTRGRIGVYEFLKMDRDLEHVILTHSDEQAIYEMARKKGMLTMKDDAIFKAFKGVIPFDEVNNII